MEAISGIVAAGKIAATPAALRRQFVGQGAQFAKMAPNHRFFGPTGFSATECMLDGWA
jgi:hypothetical protein